MVFALVTKKFRAWRIARNTRGQEFKPPQFSQGHRVGKLRYYTEGDENSQFTLVFVHGYTLAAQAWHVQVAAFADQHLHIEKTTDGQVTTSSIRALDDEARVNEMTRLLSGLPESESGREHAKELLRRAAATGRDVG